jgi:hypothetical protein
MHTEKREDPLVEMGYEIRDAKVSDITKSTAIFFAFVAGMIVIGWVVLFGFKFWIIDIPGMNPAYANRQSGYNEVRVTPSAPNPLLQTNVSARIDMSDLRKAEYRQLEGTGYSNEKRTRAHIPIDRAMDALVNGGMPPSGDVAAKTTGNTDGQMNVDTTENPTEAMQRMEATEKAAIDEHGGIGHKVPEDSHGGEGGH